MELQQLHILRDDVSGRSVLLVPPQLVVDFHNVSQFVSQVVLRGLAEKGSVITAEYS